MHGEVIKNSKVMPWRHEDDLKGRHHIVEFIQECVKCGGTGLLETSGERNGAAVVCNICKGSGGQNVRIEYDEFQGKKENKKAKWVYERNPGVVVGEGTDREGNKHKFSDFGGMSYSNWLSGISFSPGMENRKFTCPAWWYEYGADGLLSGKPNWRECLSTGTFSNCPHFVTKDKCWERWDKEQSHEE